jgi:hypothetical protein
MKEKDSDEDGDPGGQGTHKQDTVSFRSDAIESFFSTFDKNLLIQQREEEKRSEKAATTTWMRWNFGDGALCVPYYLKTLGIVFGTVVFLITYAINYFSYMFIFKASLKSKTTFFPEVVEKTCGRRCRRLFDFSYSLSLITYYFQNVVAPWVMFKFILETIGVTKHEWYLGTNDASINEYHPEVFVMRVCFYIVFYGLSLPFLLKKRIGDYDTVLLLYILSCAFLVMCMCIQMPWYYQRNAPKTDYSVNWLITKPSANWSEAIFNMLGMFSNQQVSLTFMEEIINPNIPKMKRIINRSGFTVLGINIIFGIFCYVGLGNLSTPYYLLDKSPIGEPFKIEFFETLAVIIMLLTYCFTSPMYNPTVRPLFADLLKLDLENRKSYVVLSLLPYFIFCVISILLPCLYRYTSLFSLLFTGFNSYLIPVIMRVNMNRKEGKVGISFLGLWIFGLLLSAAFIFVQTMNIIRFF